MEIDTQNSVSKLDIPISSAPTISQQATVKTNSTLSSYKEGGSRNYWKSVCNFFKNVWGWFLSCFSCKDKSEHRAPMSFAIQEAIRAKEQDPILFLKNVIEAFLNRPETLIDASITAQIAETNEDYRPLSPEDRMGMFFRTIVDSLYDQGQLNLDDIVLVLQLTDASIVQKMKIDTDRFNKQLNEDLLFRKSLKIFRELLSSRV